MAVNMRGDNGAPEPGCRRTTRHAWVSIPIALLVLLYPVACLLSATCFLMAARHHERDRGHFDEPTDGIPMHS
jgi:hypothetical protein